MCTTSLTLAGILSSVKDRSAMCMYYNNYTITIHAYKCSLKLDRAASHECPSKLTFNQVQRLKLDLCIV